MTGNEGVRRWDAGVCVVRTWRRDDAAALARHANDRRIWLNLRDGFPHPYGLADAERFLAHATGPDGAHLFAIEVEGEAAGGIGLHPGKDVERVSAELGYWLAVRHWGKGITTAAVRVVTRYAFKELGLCRVFAVPFAWNDASARVLEKAGYVREARMRRSAIKDGQVIDQWMYAMTDEDAR
jgi:RimJ/RimL family protein N-acetyltransferase